MENKTDTFNIVINIYSGDYFWTISSIGNCLHYNYSCRELFAPYFTRDTKSFVYQVRESKKIDLIINLITEIEEKLKLTLKQRIIFEKHSNKNFVKINVSRWWRQNKIRRELLTALIKTGALDKTKDKNIKNIIKGSPYFSTIKLNKALNLFLKGYTKPTTKYKNGGWVETFSQCSILRSPKYFLTLDNKSQKNIR